MPLYLTQKNNTYYFRQSIPVELRPILGKREIKKSLGQDYSKAIRECKRYAVVADNLISDARSKLDSIPIDPYSSQGIRRTKHVVITTVSPELETQVGNLTVSALLETDQDRRIAGFTQEEFAKYSEEIKKIISTLRTQLAMGNVTPMLPSVPMFLIGRG